MLGSVKILDGDEEETCGTLEKPRIRHGEKQEYGSKYDSQRDGLPERGARARLVESDTGVSPEGRTGGECSHPTTDIGIHKDGYNQREEWMSDPRAAWERAAPRKDRNAQPNSPAPSAVMTGSRHITPVATKGSTMGNTFTVGDGGASWRMKALKRAQVQAQVEGTSLTDIVQQRWSSISELASSAENAAPSDAHYRSKKSRNVERVSSMRGKMKRPRAAGLDRFHVTDSHNRKGQEKRRETSEYADLVKRAAPHMNSFKNDGSFMDQFEKGARKEDVVGKKASRVDDATAQHEDHDPPMIDSHDNHDENMKRKDNISAAAMLRARLSGKSIKTAPLSTEQNEVILPLVDAQGKAAPGAFGRETALQSHGSSDHAKRLDRYEDGKKSRYFADDDAIDLDTMVRRSKHGGDDHMDVIIARNIAKRSHFKGKEFNVDDEYEFDAGLEFLESSKASKKSRQRGDEKEELARKEKAKQVRDYKRMTRALDHCKLCLQSQSRKKHLMISIGTCAYLALPDKGRMVPGHCCIVPTEHIPSARISDESTWEEMRNFKKCVLQMFADKGKECIFFETVLDLNSARSHAIVECVPVSKSVASKAPMYFKKAIDDATNDWSQHASKRCIETESRHLQTKIPPNFPYVHIEFGLTSGFVHVIDDPKSFDPLFARRVLVGLMGLPEEDMHGRLSREGEGVQRQWVDEFRKAYTAYDWVSQIS